MSTTFPAGRKASRGIADFRAIRRGGSRAAPVHATPTSVHTEVKVQTVRKPVGRGASDEWRSGSNSAPTGCESSGRGAAFTVVSALATNH